jgi:hypothetical protein
MCSNIERHLVRREAESELWASLVAEWEPRYISKMDQIEATVDDCYWCGWNLGVKFEAGVMISKRDA